MCNHEVTITVTRGSVHLVQGEYDDDYRDVILCLDCGEEFEIMEPVDPDSEIVYF